MLQRRVSRRTLEFIRGVLFLKICGGIEPGRKTDLRMAGVASMLYRVDSAQWMDTSMSRLAVKRAVP